MMIRKFDSFFSTVISIKIWISYIDHVILGCGGTISQAGTFSSPGSSYANNLNCNWIIEKAGFSITLVFTSIRTESCCDFVYVYDYVNGAPQLLQKYSGSHSQITLTSVGGKMKVVFTSDGSVQKAGFSAQVSFGKSYLYIYVRGRILMIISFFRIGPSACRFYNVPLIGWFFLIMYSVIKKAGHKKLNKNFIPFPIYKDWKNLNLINWNRWIKQV